jgi:hypothetical protein
MINSNNLTDTLPVLLKDDDVFESIVSDFPSTLTDLVSFKNNPNCGCRGRVVKFFTQQLVKNPKALDKYIKNEQEIEDVIKQAEKHRSENDYRGRVFQIEKTEESWKDFANSLSGKTFTNFSVVERGETTVIYFL